MGIFFSFFPRPKTKPGNSAMFSAGKNGLALALQPPWPISPGGELGIYVKKAGDSMQGNLSFDAPANIVWASGIIEGSSSDAYNMVSAAGSEQFVMDKKAKTIKLSVNGSSNSLILDGAKSEFKADVKVDGKLTADGLLYPIADGAAGSVVTSDGKANLTLQPTSARRIYNLCNRDYNAYNTDDGFGFQTSIFLLGPQYIAPGWSIDGDGLMTPLGWAQDGARIRVRATFQTATADVPLFGPLPQIFNFQLQNAAGALVANQKQVGNSSSPYNYSHTLDFVQMWYHDDSGNPTITQSGFFVSGLQRYENQMTASPSVFRFNNASVNQVVTFAFPDPTKKSRVCVKVGPADSLPNPPWTPDMYILVHLCDVYVTEELV